MKAPKYVYEPDEFDTRTLVAFENAAKALERIAEAIEAIEDKIEVVTETDNHGYSAIRVTK
jgi:hypothetical protein